MQRLSAEAVFPLSNPYFSEREGTYAGATFALLTNSNFSKQEAIRAEHSLSPPKLGLPGGRKQALHSNSPFPGAGGDLYAGTRFSREPEAMYTAASYAQ